MRETSEILILYQAYRKQPGFDNRYNFGQKHVIFDKKQKVKFTILDQNIQSFPTKKKANYQLVFFAKSLYLTSKMIVFRVLTYTFLYFSEFLPILFFVENGLLEYFLIVGKDCTVQKCAQQFSLSVIFRSKTNKNRKFWHFTSILSEN